MADGAVLTEERRAESLGLGACVRGASDQRRQQQASERTKRLCPDLCP